MDGLYNRPPLAGRFDAVINHDYIGVIDSANFPPYGTAFALYFTCNLVGGAPPLTFQWISVILPDSTGATGTHQFGTGDFDANEVDSVAVRRGAFIAWTNVPSTSVFSEFSFAQYWGTPSNTGGDEVDWNSGIYFLQHIASPIGTPFTPTTWW